MYYDYPNETILPIQWVIKWVKYFRDANNSHICKSKYGLHLTEWPAANPYMMQQWQEKLRQSLKILWENDVVTGAIPSAYLKKLKKKSINKPDYYAWGVCCLIYSDIDKVTSWLDVALYWNESVLTGYKGSNLFLQIDDLHNADNCTCGQAITKGNEIFSNDIHNKHSCSINKSVIPIYRSLILGDICIKKNSIVPKVIEAARLLNIIDDNKLDEIKKQHDERTAPVAYIKNLELIVEELKKSMDKAKENDDLELKEKIDEREHLADIIDKADITIEWLKDVGKREKDRKNKPDRIIEKIVNDTNMENIKTQLARIVSLENVGKEIKDKMKRKLKEKVLLTPISELTDKCCSDKDNWHPDQLFSLLSKERQITTKWEMIKKKGDKMLERTEELKNEGVFNDNDVVEWDKKVNETTNDCLDSMENYIKNIHKIIIQEFSVKLTDRPGSNQCTGKYYDGKTTWGELYVARYIYLKYCINKNMFYRLNYDINVWFCELDNLKQKKETIEKCLKKMI